MLHARDVDGAQAGGADRLHLLRPADDEPDPRVGLAPEPATVLEVCRASDVPVRVVLRLAASWTTTGGELARLVGLAEDYLARGAEGVSFGFLGPDLDVDLEVCAHLAARLPGVPWTFHRGFDAVLAPHRAWPRLAGLPGLDAVHSAGSPRGWAAGRDGLLGALGDAGVLPLLVAAGGVVAEDVPWLVRGGLRRVHLDAQARPGGASRAYVDARHVRSWRTLLDDAVARRAR